MKTIYLDTEFSEGFFKPIGWLPKWFPGNKPRWSIELISIGLVDDQGKEYYAINRDFKRSRCNDWVKQNVLTKLPCTVLENKESWWYRNYGYDCAQVLEPNPVYKSIPQIKEDIIAFVIDYCEVSDIMGLTGGWDDAQKEWFKRNQVQFKAYYADYDWVLFCTIFGTMMDLPDGFPMYAIDIKQEMDAKIKALGLDGFRDWYEKANSVDHLLLPRDFADCLTLFKSSYQYPKQTDEHSAVADARFNKQLDEFIATL